MMMHGEPRRRLSPAPAAPAPRGNDHEHATNSAYQTKDGLVMLGASNLRQQKRLWAALGREDMAKRNNRERHADRDARGSAAARDHADPHGG